jgi:hypothetical protein
MMPRNDMQTTLLKLKILALMMKAESMSRKYAAQAAVARAAQA